MANLKKIGIIGLGNMGQAIVERVKSLFEVIIFDKDKSKTANIQKLKVASDIGDLLNRSDAIILAVKPQDVECLLEEIKRWLKDQLVISIAAGISTKYIEKNLGDVRVIRVMPNMPAQIGQGISTMCKGKFANKKDLDLSWQILSCIGETIILEDENMIDAATAISGSGPAYFCYFIKDSSNAKEKKDEFIKELTKAAMNINFDKNTAQKLSRTTVEGTISLLIELNLSCEELIKKVASKGGTTEAALDLLRKGGTLEEAARVALKRAKELSKQ